MRRRYLAATALILVACGGATASPGPGPTPTPPASPAASPAAEPVPTQVAGSSGPPVAAVAAPNASADLKVIAVPAPPFGFETRRRVKGTTVAGKDLLKLIKTSEKRNEITDEAAWFQTNGVSLNAVGDRLPGLLGPRPASVPETFRGARFDHAVKQADGTMLAIYGGRWVLWLDGAGAPKVALDFASFARAPETAPGDEKYVEQGVRWAEIAGGVLYVSSFHRTYARSSRGKNAFLTAIDLEDGALRWQSEPLVANAANFLLWDGFLVTGYGFTDEPDHIIVVDQATGATLAKTFVKSGPSYLVRKGDQLLVRTYDTDYAFTVE